MSLATIHAMASEVGRKAKRNGKQPYYIDSRHTIDQMHRFPFPNLGDYCPKGWTEVRRLFVDKCGLSDTAELMAHGCLSADGLRRALKVGYGYAIVEEGQFQLYVGEFIHDGHAELKGGAK